MLVMAKHQNSSFIEVRRKIFFFGERYALRAEVIRDGGSRESPDMTLQIFDLLAQRLDDVFSLVDLAT